MKCPSCDKEIKTAEDFKSVKGVAYNPYLEVHAECECGQRFYTSLTEDDLQVDE